MSDKGPAAIVVTSSIVGSSRYRKTSHSPGPHRTQMTGLSSQPQRTMITSEASAIESPFATKPEWTVWRLAAPSNLSSVEISWPIPIPRQHKRDDKVDNRLFGECGTGLGGGEADDTAVKTSARVPNKWAKGSDRCPRPWRAAVSQTRQACPTDNHRSATDANAARPLRPARPDDDTPRDRARSWRTVRAAAPRTPTATVLRPVRCGASQRGPYPPPTRD